MTKQTVCIVGNGLTAYITALTLNKLNLKIDLIADDFKKNLQTLRTTAISQTNYDYLASHKIFNSPEKKFWSCKKMKLYESDNEILEFDMRNTKNNILYMISNQKIFAAIKKKIKKSKKIKIKKKNNLSSSNQFKYNLIIICSGADSYLAKNFLKNNHFSFPYNEIAVTTIINHRVTNNNTAKQLFLTEGPLALLPISGSKTSVVWTINKDFLPQKNKNLFFKSELLKKIKNIYKKIKFTADVEYKELNFQISTKYYNNRTLIFGDALHSVHPMAGQGFNMTLRDLIKLEHLLKKNISLGLDIGNSEILSMFSQMRKPNNFIYSLGINSMKNFFSLQNSFIQNLRIQTLKQINNNNMIKKTFIKLADKGINI